VSRHREEVQRGARFAFGENWRLLVDGIDDARIHAAEASLRAGLGVDSLMGKRFLDAGCGSGLFSLAARRLGAEVVSFDFDPASVSCARVLLERFRPGDGGWRIAEGSVLDEQFLATLGEFDVVYSWGVLHHTGAMWSAIDRVAVRVAPGGTFWIALYNDQGLPSRFWLAVKKTYNAVPAFLRPPIVWIAFARMWGPTLLRDVLRRQPMRSWREYGRTGRGMSPWRDVVDWVGGLPFEVASPEAVVCSVGDLGFDLLTLDTRGRGYGCNEFIFARRGEGVAGRGGVVGEPARRG